MKFPCIAILSTALLLSACERPAPEQAETPKSAEAPVALKAPTGTYVLDPTHANLDWSLQYNGMSNYTARFDTYDATLHLDAGDVTKSKIEVKIDPLSVNANYPGDYVGTHKKMTGFSSWNEDLGKSAKHLNAKVFPTITFASTSIEKTGARTANVTGDLTFLGQTHPVTLEAEFIGEMERHPFVGAPAVGFAAKGSFKRSDFGMPAGGPLGDDVTISFSGEFIRDPNAK